MRQYEEKVGVETLHEMAKITEHHNYDKESDNATLFSLSILFQSKQLLNPAGARTLVTFSNQFFFPTSKALTLAPGLVVFL